MLELLQAPGWQIDQLVVSPVFEEKHRQYLNDRFRDYTITTPLKLNSLGHFKQNEQALAVVRMRKPEEKLRKGLHLVLDDIRDPGNLGTIIRLADWYGVAGVHCSTSCADFYNPKTISATMGSFLRIVPTYESLEDFLADFNGSTYAAVLEGESIYTKPMEEHAALIIGNESHGVSETLLKANPEPLTIPKVGQAESLNAAMATAILCDHYRRSLA